MWAEVCGQWLQAGRPPARPGEKGRAASPVLLWAHAAARTWAVRNYVQPQSKAGEAWGFQAGPKLGPAPDTGFQAPPVGFLM